MQVRSCLKFMTHRGLKTCIDICACLDNNEVLLRNTSLVWNAELHVRYPDWKTKLLNLPKMVAVLPVYSISLFVKFLHLTFKFFLYLQFFMLIGLNLTATTTISDCRFTEREESERSTESWSGEVIISLRISLLSFKDVKESDVNIRMTKVNGKWGCSR